MVRNISHDLILGADFLRQTSATIDYKLGVVTIGDDLVSVPLQSYKVQECCIVTIEPVCVPAHSEALITVRCPTRFNGKTVMIEPISTFQFRMFAVARSFSRCGDGKTVCRILNYNPNALVLRKGIRVATIEQAHNIVSCAQYTENVQTNLSASSSQTDRQPPQVLDKFLADYGFTINPQLSREQKYELLQLLYDYKEVFARSLDEIRQYSHYELDIELMSKQKAFRRQFRLHKDDADIAQNRLTT